MATVVSKGSGASTDSASASPLGAIPPSRRNLLVRAQRVTMRTMPAVAAGSLEDRIGRLSVRGSERLPR